MTRMARRDRNDGPFRNNWWPLRGNGGTVSGPKNPADGFQEVSLPGVVLMETWLPHIGESWDFVRHRHGNQKHTDDTCYVRSRDTELSFLLLPFPPIFFYSLDPSFGKKKILYNRNYIGLLCDTSFPILVRINYAVPLRTRSWTRVQ